MASRTNLLIDSLSPDLRRQVLAFSRSAELPQGTRLYEPGEAVSHVHFLTSGLASVVVWGADGSSAEVAMVGTEGIAGGLGVLGPHLPIARCFMQVAGTAIRMPMPEMRRLFHESEEFRTRLLESMQQQSLALHQIAACNKLHHATERLARWLLSASDRLDSDVVGLTQESIAQILGTRRTTIALAAGMLQDSGLIRYRRGMVKIVKREELAEVACDCYGITRKLLEDLYSSPVAVQQSK